MRVKKTKKNWGEIYEPNLSADGSLSLCIFGYFLYEGMKHESFIYLLFVKMVINNEV